MSLKSAYSAAAAFGIAALQGGPSLFQDSGYMDGYFHIGKAPKKPLTTKQKKVRKANRKASKSRAKNRRK